ncbi:MAG TPA: hypothetical protein VFE93_10355 [Myxococcaceae bacterium]|nr:hypothetical protein [Myxococcaceae bacterium]
MSQMLIQPFINYNLDDGWYLTSSPIIIADWKADTDKWSVPLGGGVGKILWIGQAPITPRCRPSITWLIQQSVRTGLSGSRSSSCCRSECSRRIQDGAGAASPLDGTESAALAVNQTG